MPGLVDHAYCSYEKIVEYVMRKPQADVKTFPCIFPSWDNSPRKKTSATVIQNEDAALYGKWLADALNRVRNNPVDERIVFINAWNEWAEGNHLEPDQKFGRSYLAATLQAMEESCRATRGVTAAQRLSEAISSSFQDDDPGQPLAGDAFFPPRRKDVRFLQSVSQR